MKKIFTFIFFYFPFRVFKYYDKEPSPVFKSVAVLVTICMLYVMSFTLLLNSITGESYLHSKNRIINKYVNAPIVIAVVVGIMFTFYFFNKIKYRKYFAEFENYPEALSKKLGVYLILFLAFTLLFFVLSVIGSVWISKNL